jgi:phosphohistidine phosphatase SixA
MKIITTFSTLLILIVSLFACSKEQASENVDEEQKPLLVFLVRHAEKTNQKEDPGLSEAGKVRALELKKVLRSADIEYVHSSDFIRTRETALPTAEMFELTTKIYDPRDLEALAQKLKAIGGNHLVVGHSNTTPQLAGLLGGSAVSEINEKSEYDRLYIVSISANGDVSSVLMRYGNPYLEE